MNISLALIALFQLLLSILLGVSLLFITYRLVRWVLRRRYDIKPANTAFAIFVSTIMFSVGYLGSSVVHPLMSTFRVLSAQSRVGFGLLGQFSSYLFLFLGISGLVALLVNLLGTFLFTQLNREVNELEEISKNDVAVAIVTGAMVIVISLFARDAVVFLLESLAPYPEVKGIDFP